MRLVARFTGRSWDVVGDTNYNDAVKDGYRSFLDLQGIGKKRATDLYEADFKSAGDVAVARVEDLLSIKGMSETRAEELIKEATRYIDERAKRAKLEKDKPKKSETAKLSENEIGEATDKNASDDENTETDAVEKSETEEVQKPETEDPPNQNNGETEEVKVPDE